MIAILSPAKSLDFEEQFDLPSSKIRFNAETNALIDVLSKKTHDEVKSLMNISDQLTTLNLERYQNYKKRTPSYAKQAILAFQGDVYQGMQAEAFTKSSHEFAQEHIRILSGLYGLLRPLDLIQPYRLEMGTKLKIGEHNSLYTFWKDLITTQLQKDLKAQGDNLLINLASNEYFKSIDKQALKKKIKIVDVEFKDFSNGKFKIVSFFAKKARGMMAKYIVEHKLTQVEALKAFDSNGYYYDQENSTDLKLCFKREKQ